MAAVPARPAVCATASRDSAKEALPEDEEEEETGLTGEDTVFDLIQRVAEEDEERERAAGTLPYLKVGQQRTLRAWQPAAPPEPQQQRQQGAADAAAAGGEPAAALTAEELLAQLPGLQRQLRAAAQERVGLPPAERQFDVARHLNDRMPRKPEPELTEWDLRARMEKRKRQQKQREAWNARRAAVGHYPSLGADWRSDIRCKETGDPTDPHYREWTHKEIWDLITMNGTNADPRDVAVFVRDPKEIVDAPAQGGGYRMEPEEYFESIGALIHEEDLAAIAGSAGDGVVAADGTALLAAEFSDFDDELGDFDSDYGGGAAAGDEDEF
ncbi:hypothetical protein C2E20_4467 [Micractinium conductrix]|uniref:Uncharacterized protein n=1 Tax=Micractinium conductrix TaxID=554055 RepID=A0A2P6VDV6_9CHLO|nr:hypothetical protein C2E20_4467 [Micractinium conductrix]|eukprot:PSC72276.1 hypothetical protein C2E20_4467 [Micractinium conductrix]